MKEYKVTKDKILAMASECSEAKTVLKKGFPEAFKEEWEDITRIVKPEIIYAANDKPYLRFVDPQRESTGSGLANSAAIGYTPSITIPLFIYQPENYKVEKHGEESFRIYRKKR